MKRQACLLYAIVAAMSLAACSRSDVGITASVEAKFLAEPTIRPFEIGVTTDKGVVTLKGNIDSQEAKEHALAIAKDTSGVVRVTDMIEVRRASGGGDAPSPGRTLGVTIDDAGITMTVKRRLLDDTLVKGLHIDVDTRAGVVYLTGDVSSDEEKKQAIALARATAGVKEVLANLKIVKG